MNKGEMVFKPLLMMMVQAIVVACFAVQHIGAEEQIIKKDAAYQKAFDALITDPSNPENSFQFASQAIRVGDLQGGITAFERILKINPGLDNIKLELGVLYLRVGANELADQYISEALRSPQIPLLVKNRAKSLQKSAQKASSPHNVSFQVGLGFQYDDNATFAPSTREILVGGQPGFLSEESTGKSDSAAVFNTSASYVYSFNSQIGNQLEAGFSYSSRDYDESKEIDSDYVAFQIGPRFYYGEVLNPSWSLKPFIRASQLNLDGDDYQESEALGIELSRIFSITQMLSVQALYSDKEYINSDTRTTISERSGDEWNLGVRYSKLLKPTIRGFIALNSSSRDAEVAFEEREAVSAITGFSKSYRAPLGIKQRWNTSLVLSYDDVEYDSPDPAVDPFEARKEQRTQISWSNNFVFNRTFFSTLRIYHTDNQSSLPNFEYDNTGINLTFRASF